MPRRQVYGKRNTNVYSSFAGFTSPAKPRQLSVESPVLEVTEELAKLTVHEHISQEEGTDKASRRALGERDGNAVLHKPLSKSPAKKQTVKVESTQDNSEATQAPSPCTSEREQQVSATLKAVSESEAGSTTPALSEQLPLAASPPTNCLEATASEPQVPKISNLYTTYAEPLLSLSSHPLSSFSTWSDQLSSHFAVTKIAEASFGEVYRLALLRPHATLGRADESVLKIIALKPPEATRKRLSKAAKKRVEMMSDLEDVASEVRLMQRMTSIPGFTMFRECCVLQGRPGDSFVSAWRSWNESQKTKGKETSVFPDPGKKASYSENQLWAVIEMQDAGTDLENVNIHDIWTAWDVFWGVVLALGKGEDDVRFEHRDLHMGNICVSIRDRPLSSHYQCDYACIDANKTLGFTGIETTLIDYTISRAELTRNNGGGEDDVAFLDLEKDVALFEGDAEEEYQYEIYRYMRAAMYVYLGPAYPHKSVVSADTSSTGIWTTLWQTCTTAGTRSSLLAGLGEATIRKLISSGCTLFFTKCSRM